MTLVIDTSVVLKWYLREDDSDRAIAHLGSDLIAPALLRIELANALWKKVRRAELSSLQAVAALAEAAAVVPVVAVDLSTRALEIALELSHPIYDCVFLAFAEANRAALLTADVRFLRRCATTRYAQFVERL